MDGARRAGGTGIPWGMPHTSRGGRICTDLTVCTPTVTHRCRAAALPGVACPAGARLFWKSRGKSTRGVRPPGPRGTRGDPAGRRPTHAMWSLAVAACNCFCVWLLRFGFCGGSCSTFEAALPLASPCQGSNSPGDCSMQSRRSHHKPWGTAEGGGRVATLQRAISL